MRHTADHQPEAGHVVRRRRRSTARTGRDGAQNGRLGILFTKSGFRVDRTGAEPEDAYEANLKKRMLEDPYGTLYAIGFEERGSARREAAPLAYLRRVAEEFIRTLTDIPEPSGRNMTEKMFTGPIQYQLRDALLYIRNYVLKEQVLKQKNRPETRRIWNYPYQALEEILSNAVYHRSYQIREPITVRVTPDAMEVTSFPGFDRSITDADIASGHIRGRIYRNRRIGDFLKELGLIEGRNTGFPNAVAALKVNGSPPLRFEMDAQRQYLSVTIPVHPAFYSAADKKAHGYEQKIREILSGEPMTLTELAHAMGYKGITKKLRDTVRRMQDQGEIQQSVDANRMVRYVR